MVNQSLIILINVMKKITLSLVSLVFALTMLVACNNAPKAPVEEAESTTVIENVDVTVDTTAVEADTVSVEVEVVE
ncbi:MAG: hypothetical protein JW729_02190 [Bacteroidales bacterium]|nr:hypothetical protein [Bacteroidales bacterium]